MGFQLIFVVESKKTSKSDWIYIKSTIEHFYQYDQAHIKLSPAYMGGKGNYKTKEKEISSLVSQYRSVSKMNQTKVIYCFDCDDYDIKIEDASFLNEAYRYCEDRGYEFVWFCKNIEQVYLEKAVGDNQKTKEAEIFKARKKIAGIDDRKLSFDRYQVNASNILLILDRFLQRNFQR